MLNLTSKIIIFVNYWYMNIVIVKTQLTSFLQTGNITFYLADSTVYGV